MATAILPRPERTIRNVIYMNLIYPNTIIERYLLRQFLTVLGLCIFASTSLFLVFDLFERMRIFIRDETTFFVAFSYMALKIPMIVHLMTPVGILIATLLSIGRLSQQSEITAMRTCGLSIFSLARPLLMVGVVISVLMFILGETIVPWATDKVDEIYSIDIKKEHLSGSYDRANFWYRLDNRFYEIGFFDSRTDTLKDVAIFEFDDDFRLKRRIDSEEVVWNQHPSIRWTMKNVVEISLNQNNGFSITQFDSLPLVIDETPESFRSSRKKPETMGYFELHRYIEKLRSEGVHVTKYLVDAAAKVAFPFINILVILVAFPFALGSARSGKLTKGFIWGVSLGFGYYIVFAVSSSFGAAELLPIHIAAWTANILVACLGIYLMANAEFQS